jgi:mono/diheme cytochrome c family protein
MRTFKRILKWTGIVLAVFIIGLVITVAMRQNLKFEAPYPDIHASKDSAVIARGQYLVYSVGHCADCHADPADIEKVGKGEIVDLVGGKVFDIPPGKFYARNITPDPETGIGKYTDGEIARIFRYGVKPDGTTALPFMPYQNVSDEDLTAIISYLRSMEPVKHENKEHEVNLLGRVVKAFMLTPTGPEGEVPKHVDVAPTAEYGKYLAHSVANCRGCHTDRDLKTGKFIGEDFAGGLTFENDIPGYKFVTPNITRDEKTGRLARWDEDFFVTRFKQGKVVPHTIMPWGPYSRMGDTELRAIYQYLKTVKTVNRDNGPSIVKLEE